MDLGQSLESPDNWLRLWRVGLPQGSVPGTPRDNRVDNVPRPGVVGAPETGLMRLQLTNQNRDESANRVSYEVVETVAGSPGLYLVQIIGDNVHSTTSLVLDADFPGTSIDSQELLDALWDVPDSAPLTGAAQTQLHNLWRRLIGVQRRTDPSVQLPSSGEGSEGGRFHSLFFVFPPRQE
jgi:hypothetical protein